MKFFIFLFFYLIAFNISADEKKDIKIYNLHIQPNFAKLNFLTLYLTIENNTNKTDFLLKITSNFAKYCKIQKTIIENNIASVVAIEKISIPAKSKISFDPGSIHIYIKDLEKKTLNIGDKIKFKFFFENSGQIEVELIVK